MIPDRFSNLTEIPHECTFCDLRHGLCNYDIPKDGEECSHFKLGGCFTCQLGGYDGAKDEEIVEGGKCVSVLAFDFETCVNYRKDKALWKEYKQVKKIKRKRKNDKR